MEAGSERHDEDEDNNEDGHEGEEHVLEEDDVLPHDVQQLHVLEQVKAGKGDGESADLPLAT